MNKNLQNHLDIIRDIIKRTEDTNTTLTTEELNKLIDKNCIDYIDYLLERKILKEEDLQEIVAIRKSLFTPVLECVKSRAISKATTTLKKDSKSRVARHETTFVSSRQSHTPSCGGGGAVSRC